MKIRRQLSRLLALGSLLLLSSAPAHAQVTTADLVGTIRDTSRGVVPGVTVALTNEATGVSRSATTGAAATTSSRRCSPAATRLTAEISGFRKVERTGVNLQVNQRAQIDLELEVGLIERDRRRSRAPRRCSKPNRPSSAPSSRRSRCRTCRSADATSCSWPRSAPGCRARAPACAARS